MIQITGISVRATATVFAVPQPSFCRPVVLAVAISASLRKVRAGGGGAEALDEQERADGNADKDQDGDGRPEAEVQCLNQVAVAGDRDRAGAVAARRQDVD